MSYKDLWLQIILALEENLKRANVITWFKNTAILSMEDGLMTVGLPLPMFLDWHVDHYMKDTLAEAQKLDSSVKSIAYLVDTNLNEGDPRVIDILSHFPAKTSRKLPNKREILLPGGIVSKMFNHRYRLDNFIIGPENRLAHAACMTVAKYPGENYNPLFIYGGVGLGKTHLLQATGNEILRNDRNRIVVYTTTEAFTNEVVDCIQSRDMNRFRNRYRKVDALIIDDIQFIANKDRTQEEFFHTFNTLFDAGKQIIISSDRPPHELSLLSERLISRFESGMIVDVKMPDLETRMAILQNKCQEAQVIVSRDVIEFIALNMDHSLRALEGILQRVIAQYELEHTTPTVKSVAEFMKQIQKELKVRSLPDSTLNEDTPKYAVTIDHLIEFISNYYQVPKTEVTGESRNREYMVPRQMIMYLAKTKLKISLVKIGESLGNRNHTTVMHAIDRVGTQLKNDRQLLRDLNAIKKEVGIN